MLSPVKDTTDTGVLAMVLEDMQAASLIDLKSDKEINPSRLIKKLASRLRSNREIPRVS